MKTRLLLTLLLSVLLAGYGFGQRPYFDALALKNKLVTGAGGAQNWANNDQTVVNILSQYCDTADFQTSLANDNPYLRGYMANWNNYGFVDMIPGLLSSFGGGINATTLADGLGKFLAERTKEEINIAFFDKFRLLLGEYPELGKAFPATVKYLDVVMNHDYANLLPTLKEAFERDLKTLPKNLLSISTLQPEDCRCKGERQVKCQQRIRMIQELFRTEEGSVVVASLVVTDAILNHTSAPEIFTAVTENDLIKNNNNSVSNILRLLGLVSNSVRDTADTDRWITAPQAKNMLKDKTWLRIYVGLVYQQIKNDSIVIAGDTLWKKMDAVEPTLTGFSNYIYPVVSNGEALTNDLKSWKDKDSVTAGDINVFVGHFRQFFQSVTRYSTINPALIKEPNAKTKLVFYVTDQGLEITQNILVKNYSAAIISSLLMVDTLMATQTYTTRKGAIDIDNDAKINGKTDPETVAKIKHELLLDAKTPAQMRLALKSRDYKDDDQIKSAYETYQKKYLNDKDSLTSAAVNYYITQQYLTKMAFKRNFVRYGAFMANVILAKNSDDVKKAIQSVALPPGSSSIKKTTNFSITLQAYTGFSGGREVANLRTPASQGVFLNALSVYAPVGVAFNIGLKSHRNPSNKYNAGSLSAMFSIIDVGAIFAYRFSDPGTALPDSIKIRLENIFAPGVNVVYAIPKVPLSIGTGIQWQPSLTRFSNTGTTITNQSGVRWQLFLVFDLPMLNLYTSKR